MLFLDDFEKKESTNLHSTESGKSHVEKYPIEYWHRNVLQIKWGYIKHYMLICSYYFSWNFFPTFLFLTAFLNKILTLRTDVIKTAHPLRIPMPRAVTLCSLKKKKNTCNRYVFRTFNIRKIWFKHKNDNKNFMILYFFLKLKSNYFIFSEKTPNLIH